MRDQSVPPWLEKIGRRRQLGATMDRNGIALGERSQVLDANLSFKLGKCQEQLNGPGQPRVVWLLEVGL